MYAYVGNNPTTLTDSTGLCPSSDLSEICNAGVGSGRENQAQQQNPNQVVGNTTEGSLAKVLTKNK